MGCAITTISLRLVIKSKRVDEDREKVPDGDEGGEEHGCGGEDEHGGREGVAGPIRVEDVDCGPCDRAQCGDARL